MNKIDKEILVISDTHGKKEDLTEVLKNYYSEESKPDILFHLGDGRRDLDLLEVVRKDIDMVRVDGNVDVNGGELQTEIKLVGNVMFVCRHYAFGEGGSYDIHSFDKNILNYISSREEYKKADVVICMHGHKHINHINEVSKFGVNTDKKLVVMSPGSISAPKDGYSPKHSFIEIDYDGNIFIENRDQKLEIVNRMLIPLTKYKEGTKEYEEKAQSLAKYIMSNKPEYAKNVYENSLDFTKAIEESFDEIVNGLTEKNFDFYLELCSKEQIEIIFRRNPWALAIKMEDKKTVDLIRIKGVQLNPSNFSDLFTVGLRLGSIEAYYSLFGEADTKEYILKNVTEFAKINERNLDFLPAIGCDIETILKYASEAKISVFKIDTLLKKIDDWEIKKVDKFLDTYKNDQSVLTFLIYSFGDDIEQEKLDEIKETIDLDKEVKNENINAVLLYVMIELRTKLNKTIEQYHAEKKEKISNVSVSSNMEFIAELVSLIREDGTLAIKTIEELENVVLGVGALHSNLLEQQYDILESGEEQDALIYIEDTYDDAMEDVLKSECVEDALSILEQVKSRECEITEEGNKKPTVVQERTEEYTEGDIPF